ncbi:MAG: Methyltransferase FkbM [Candidatus Magnetoglobus multicellularis str. Araruama]|uniref:Methyltransferase FkbM n=1 Tax=Candidatus Magnetoglobus multicellularis str. Araruama TaxID=890399 RepID=A0A1V1PIM7_9BACT|nr:MAG: Methyltransferase FkbM [Candidatus Magnetoglobus multicellularis str. Araruama]
MFLANLLKSNWYKPVIPRKWLRFLYRSEILESNNDMSLPFEIDFFGMKYSGNINNVIDFHCFFYGAFEKGQLFFWRDIAESLFKNKGTFVDIGANVGQHSIYMSKKASIVHAFEPYEVVCKKITEKIQLNGLTNIVVHNVGIGDKDALMPFHKPTGNNLGVGTFVGQHDYSETTSDYQLPVVSGDDYFKGIISQEVNMIKIDVEGFEKHVIIGLNKTITEHRPIIVFELGLGLDCSFSSNSELIDSFPSDYLFLFLTYGISLETKINEKMAIFVKKVFIN